MRIALTRLTRWIVEEGSHFAVAAFGHAVGEMIVNGTKVIIRVIREDNSPMTEQEMRA